LFLKLRQKLNWVGRQLRFYRINSHQVFLKSSPG
jgi:hypothetical protein